MKTGAARSVGYLALITTPLSNRNDNSVIGKPRCGQGSIALESSANSLIANSCFQEREFFEQRIALHVPSEAEWRSIPPDPEIGSKLLVGISGRPPGSCGNQNTHMETNICTSSVIFVLAISNSTLRLECKKANQNSLPEEFEFDAHRGRTLRQ